MSTAKLKRLTKKLRRMRATLAAYEQAEAMAAEKARRQRQDIQRTEQELAAASRFRDVDFERVGEL